MFKSGLGLFAAAWIALVAPPAHAAGPAPDPAGDWNAAFVTTRGPVAFFVHLRANGGGYTGVLDSPDQGAEGLALADISAQGDTLSFAMPAAKAHYSAHWDAAAGAWGGHWDQGTASLPLDFVREDTPAGVDGVWTGLLADPNTPLHLAIRIHTDAKGVHGDIASPDQGPVRKALAFIHRQAQAVSFDVPANGGRFEGRLAADGRTLSGRWMQNGSAAPLTLTLSDRPATANRPQTPRPPFPYRSVEVGYDNLIESAHLAGTLTLPPGAGPFPTVLLITGSGLHDRDETVFEHKPFLVLADYLTRRGIAVLRVDNRSMGGSTGDVAHVTSADFATDVEAGVRFLKTRPEIDPRRIGLIGHSEGGMIAPMVAASDPSVAFVVLMAGPALRGDEAIQVQIAAIQKAGDVPPDRVKAQAATERTILRIVEEEPDDARASARLSKVWADVPDRERAEKIAQITLPWSRYALTYDPAPALAKLRCPVLAIGGTLDLQVPVSANTPALRRALAHNPQASVVELPGLNHMFQTAKTGLVDEYGTIEETMSPVALKTVGDWVVAHAR